MKIKKAAIVCREFIGRNLVWTGLSLLLGEELRALGDPQAALVLFPWLGAGPLGFQTTDPLERERRRRRLSQYVLFRGHEQTATETLLEMSRPA
jgi:hypothetical protein